MRTFYLFFFSLLMAMGAASQVNSFVIVKGYVINTNGVAVNNQPVYIWVDSTNSTSGCIQSHIKYTNPNGYYIDTLYCQNGSISIVKVSTPNCNGSILNNVVTVPSTRIVESNFTICSPVNTCRANFSFSISGKIVQFSNLSTSGPGTGINQVFWNFGDGQTSTLANPVHTYAMGGAYVVSLTISTTDGCSNTMSATINISSPTTCIARFTSTPNSSSGNVFTFNSSTSQTSSGDSIMVRYWSFGDGTSGTGVISSHTYSNPGNYLVCLYIQSATGCRDSVCSMIQVTSTSCQSYFTATVSSSNSKSVLFNSSSATPTNSIIYRTWSFGDGDTLGGNVISPVHNYLNPGTYTVCLKITTANNCTNTFCKSITIANTTPGCQAYFNYLNNSGGSYVFQSYSQTATGDSIRYYLWLFGDGDSTITNVGGVQHTFLPGNYTVCLKIVTASGCTSTYCKPLTVMQDTTCKAAFTFTHSPANNFLVQFNSSTSSGAGVAVTSRTWNFGDNITLSGNVVDPQHIYNQPGTYNVCLTITTGSGCTNTICKTITISNPLHCVARFIVSPSPTVPPSGNGIMLNSSSSETIAGDSIIERNWFFGDSTQLGGNVVSPIHNYAYQGQYYVCLIIRTASGCKDTTCQLVQVPLTSSVTCNAIFSASPSILNNLLYGFNSANSYAVPASNIITRVWSFGDGDTLRGNTVDPQHLYAQPGTYNVCLTITSGNGCTVTNCKTITISPLKCQAKLTVTMAQPGVLGYQAYFNSSISQAVAGDSIVERIWNFGDGVSLGGNTVAPAHLYLVSGTYNACLIIRTAKGCSDTACIVVKATTTVPNTCSANFTFYPSGTTVRFLGNYSVVATGDSIISRLWSFGDSTYLSGNVVNPTHIYPGPGVYNVCLKIITAAGCQNTVCKVISVSNSNPTTCVPYYSIERLNSSPLTVRLNSSASVAPASDSIVTRRWNFGDGSPILSGNIVNPLHTYPFKGVYTTCLRITTARGCTNEYCTSVRVGDSTVNVDTTEPIKLISLSPNPASQQFNTIVWSKFNNVQAEFAIYDVYGVRKWSFRKILLQGNNITVIPCYFLLPGPYYLRVTTIFGIKSRKFYKM